MPRGVVARLRRRTTRRDTGSAVRGDTAKVPTPPAVPPAAPEVTVVVTAFEEGGLIADCIASIRAQTHANWECIVLDDASSDGTVDAAIAAIGGDPRFRVLVSDRNVGVAHQRNAGIVAAGAPLIAFVDADDFLFPGSLATRLAGWRSDDHPARAGVFGDWIEVPFRAVPGDPAPKAGRRRPRVTWFRHSELLPVPFILSAPLVSRDALLAVGGFSDRPVGVDAELWQRMLRAGFFFDPVPEVGAAYRQRPSSLHRDDVVAAADELAGLVERNLEQLDGPGFGPWPFGAPAPSYAPDMIRARRLVRAAAFRVAAGLDPGPAVDAFGDLFEPYMEWMLPLDRVAMRTGRLAALAVDRSGSAAAALVGEVAALFAPFVDRGRSAAGGWLTAVPAPESLDGGDAIRRPAG